MLGLAVAIIMALVATRTSSLYNSAGRDRGWEEAVLVAESALDTALTQIAANPAYSTVPLGTDLSTRDKVVAAAAQLAASPANLILTPDGQFVIVRAAGSMVVYGVGATPSWTDARRQVRVVEATFSATTATGCWPDAAFVGRGLIEIGSSSTISTSPAIRHLAAAYGNGNFKGASGTYLDGDIRIAGTTSGVGASNVCPTCTIQAGANPFVFPTTGELTTWENELIAAAQAGGTHAGIDLSTAMTLTAPVYVNGDIMLRSGGRLTINGTGVVYVTGRVEMGGDSTLTNGALLAVHGQFKQGGGTDYRLGSSPATQGLVSFQVNSAAIEFQGSALGSQGVIYAARGGVKLSGSAALQGAAVAGGEGTYGQIKAGGGTTMTYPAGLLPSATWLPRIGGGPVAACSSSSTSWFGNGAILSNGSVKLSGGAYTFSDPAGSGVADVLTNGNYADNTSKVDGSIVAGGTVTVNPVNVSGTVTAGAGQVVTFPPADAIAAWRSQLVAAAQSGGTTIYPAVSYSTDVTLTTPRYINGNFTVSGGHTLTLTGGGVFFVAGNLTMSGGGAVYNSGIIAADGVIVISGGGGYHCTADNPSGAGLFSFSTNSKAIELSGGSGAPLHGVAYAVNGGVVLSGGSNWTGMLISGGAGMQATFSGASRITYPAGFFGTVTSLPVPPPRLPTSTTVVTLTGRREL